MLSCYASECTFRAFSVRQMQTHIEDTHIQQKFLIAATKKFDSSLASTAIVQHTTSGPIRNTPSHNTRLHPYTSLPSLSKTTQVPIHPDLVLTSLATSTHTLSEHTIMAPNLRLPKKHKNIILSPESTTSTELASPPSNAMALLPLSSLAVSTPHQHLVPFDKNNTRTQEENSSNEAIVDVDTIGILSKAGLRVLSVYGSKHILICVECRIGVTQKNAVAHSCTMHHIQMSIAERKTLNTIVQSLSIQSASQDIPTPPPHQAPIAGLKVFLGFSCQHCAFCAISSTTMDKHKSQSHRDLLQPASATYISASVQTYFICHPHFFHVINELAGLPFDNPYARYLDTVAPVISKLELLNPPIHEHEIPPLLKVTQWNIHLQDFVKTKSKVALIYSLTKPPTSDTPYGSRLATLINNYMCSIRQLAKDAHIEVKYLLIECPRYVFSTISIIYVNINIILLV